MPVLTGTLRTGQATVPTIGSAGLVQLGPILCSLFQRKCSYVLFVYVAHEIMISVWIGSRKMPHPIRTLNPCILVSFPLVITRKANIPTMIVIDQQSFDPYNGVAGNGMFPNGSYVPAPDPHSAYVPWNVTIAKQWLSSLKNKPTFVNIDNEIEIARSTHQDMHPWYVAICVTIQCH